MKNYIYALVDPRTNEVRYIGVTNGLLAYRLRQHLKRARDGGRSHRCCWIRDLLYSNVMPRIVLLETTRDRTRECYWIRLYRSKGVKLTNLTDGGDGTTGRKLTAEQIAKRTQSRKGYCHSEDTKKRIGLAHKGIQFNESTLERMRQAKLGKRIPEHKKQKYCSKGHPLFGDNLRIEAYGSRRCKACHRETDERWRTKNLERSRALARERARRYRNRKKTQTERNES